MVYKCDRCSKEFKGKTDYTRHKNRKKPCNSIDVNDKKFKCSKCNKSYTSNGNLTRHINNSHSCKSKLDKTLSNSYPKNGKNGKKLSEFNPKQSEINPKTTGMDNLDKEFKCSYCFKTFTYNHNLKRHLKSRCKVKIETEKQKEEIFLNLLDEMNIMKNEIKELKSENARLLTQPNITNNTTNNTSNHNIVNNNNQTLNINLVAFGHEDKEQLSNLELYKIIKKGFKSIPEFVKVLHFDENKPENHNIYIPNMSRNYVMIFDGEKWGLVDSVDTIENIFDDGRNFLAERKDAIEKMLSDKNRRVLVKFDRFDHDIDHFPGKKNEILNDIKLILYNNRDIPISNRNKSIKVGS